MIKITVKKINFKELEVLQYELERFATHVAVNDLKTDFLNAVITIDSSRNLFIKLRDKIENSNTTCTISFSICEVATILKCSLFENPERSIYSRNVLTKFNLYLDQKLKSLV